MSALLEIRGLRAGYGAGRIIVDGVDLDAAAGEVVTVIGQNGAGKSTLLKGVFALAPTRSGSVRLDGRDMAGLRPDRLLAGGLAYVPQNPSVFPKLTVRENLAMGGYLIPDPALVADRVAEAEAMFPILAERRDAFAASLSGGERRMLEIARALVMAPRAIMLDEPSIGLAPRVVDLVFATVRRLAEQGRAMLMVEQNVRKALMASDRGYVLELGRVRLSDRADRLIGDARVAELYMGARPQEAAR